MTETQVKYLAGLIDADGYIGFEFSKNKVYLRINITAADSIDKQQYVYNLPETTGLGTSCKKERKNKDWSPISVWVVGTRKDLDMFIPRLLKHLVIKGKHTKRMYDKWHEYRGKVLSDIEIEQLKTYSKASRADSGSLKSRNHPTWAWVAGYLDGDGSYIYKQPPSQRFPKLVVRATSHINDRIGLDLLHKAFGGHIYDRGKNGKHILDWVHPLGKSNRDFALKFLPKVVKHSKLKKHKIEQMIAFHH